MSVFGATSSLRFLENFTRAVAKREHISGRAARGMFAGRDKSFGNNVSFSKRKYVSLTPMVSCLAWHVIACAHLRRVWLSLPTGRAAPGK